jgi:hypothetical protein
MQGRHDENKIREMLDKERQQLRLEQRANSNLKEDYGRLREDHSRMQVWSKIRLQGNGNVPTSNT